MTSPQETIVNDSALSTDSHALPVESIRPIAGGIEFLDESWAEEFDRRLAAWQSEPVPASVVERIIE